MKADQKIAETFQRETTLPHIPPHVCLHTSIHHKIHAKRADLSRHPSSPLLQLNAEELISSPTACDNTCLCIIQKDNVER